MQPDCLKGRVVCATVYGDMHLKDLLVSIVRVGYRIPVLDFYLVLPKKHCNGLNQTKSLFRTLLPDSIFFQQIFLADYPCDLKRVFLLLSFHLFHFAEIVECHFKDDHLFLKIPDPLFFLIGRINHLLHK